MTSLTTIVNRDELRKVDRRFKVSFMELAERRKAYDSVRKAALRDIEMAETVDGLKSLAARLTLDAKVYRKFDLAQISAALVERRTELSA